jgi:hypothetical protein
MSISEGAGGRVQYTTWLKLWLQELWIELTEQPMTLVPHPHRAVRMRPSQPGGPLPYKCTRCGSVSDAVQRKGRERSERIRRQLA